MITKWEEIPGVKKVYHGAFDTIVLVFKDDFAMVVAKRDRDLECAVPVLAGGDDDLALYDAVQAGATEAQELLDAAKAKFQKDFEAQERRRLAYLLEKYGGV